jgi:hypothetical protein
MIEQRLFSFELNEKYFVIPRQHEIFSKKKINKKKIKIKKQKQQKNKTKQNKKIKKNKKK